MANRYDIIRIDFQASAKGANTAIESIRQEAEQCNNKITELKKNIAEAPKNGVDAKIVEDWNAELKITEKRFKQFSTAYRELIKGVRALDEGVKMFNDGSLSQMNAAFQKTVNNAAKLAQSKLKTGTDEWRQMGALMQETEQNYARMQRDTDQLIESLQNGGTVFLKTIEDEKKGLQDLLQVLPYMGTEYRKASDQLDFLVKTTDEMAIKEKQLKGEIVTTDDARRVSIQLTEKGAEAARQRAAAADAEIEKGKQEIETLEKEREVREANARESAQAAADYRENQRMHEDEIERLDAEMRKEEDLAKSKRNGLDALQRKAMKMKDDAEAEKNTQKELDGVYDAAKEKVAKLREEVEKLRQGVTGTPAKDTVAEAVKTGAEEAAGAIKQETEAAEENTAAKKEEVKAGEEVAETNKKEAETAEALEKKHKDLVAETKNLITERDKLTKERDGLVKTLEAEAAAAEKTANAFASLSKEEAEAMLKERQAVITKGADGKFSYTNAEDAQHFLIESIKSVNPKGVSGGSMSLDSAGVAKVRAMFKERFGLQSDDDALAAIRGLLSGENGSLIKGGMMNNAFSRIDLDPSKVSVYSKIIKDLTEVINGEVKAIEEESEAKKRLEQVDTRLLELDEKIDANDKESMELWQQRKAMIGSAASATDELTEKTNELSEAKKKDAEATNTQIEAIKKMSVEEAKAAKDAMTKKSTVDYKSNKLDMSNPEEVQSWLITQMLKHGASVGVDGTLSVGGANVNSLLTGFKDRYGLKGDNQKAKQLFKDVIQGKGGGGLLREGGVIDFSADTLMVKANVEAYQGRIDKLKALFEITNKASYAAAHSTETTERGTQAVKDATEATKNQTAAEQKALEVKRLKEAYDKSQAEYEKMKEHLAGLKKKKSGLPGGMDAALERESLTTEISDYDENVKKPKGREVTKLKNQWQKAVKELAQMQTEETAAENQNTEATENNTKSKNRKKKASEDTAKATGEETRKSAELIAKEKELKDAEEEEATAKKNAEDQQKKTTKVVNDAADAETKANDAEKKYTETMKGLNDEKQKHVDGLKELNEANKDTIKTNEENQKLLAETNGKIQEQGEKIRDAERIKAQAKTEGIEKTEQAIRLLTEENRHIDQNSFTWKRNTIEIQHLQEALDEMKNKPVLMMMEQRMKNVGALSASAVTETKKFWEAMVAGAEKGSESLKHAEAHLKTITEEEQKRNLATMKASADRLSGNLGLMSQGDIRQAIEDAKKYQLTLGSTSEEAKKLAQAIVNAEEHLKRYGVEAERAARKQEEDNKKAERAARDKEEVEAKAQQDQLRMMRERIVFEKQRQSLSADALAETKKYWEAVARGANEGSWAQKNALTMMERITAEEERRAKKKNVEKADRLTGARYLTLSESELRESIEAARELQKTLSPTESLYKSLSKQIAIAEEHIKKYGVEAQRVALREAQEAREAKQAFEDAVAGKFDKASMEELDEVIKKIKEYQATIKDPTGDGAQAFNDAKVQIDALSGRLNTLKGVAEKVTGTFASADEVMTRWAEHMNAGKTASEGMAQTLDEKLAGATSSWDDSIEWDKERIKVFDDFLKKATENLDKMEKELAELEQKHANSSWFRKQTSAYKREFWQIEDLRDAIGREQIDDEGNPFTTGAKGRAAWYRDTKKFWEDQLKRDMQRKADELGITESINEEAAAEEKKADAKKLTNEQMQQGIKLLEEEYAKTDHTTEEGIKKRQQLREAIDQMNQELKESTGEWMSVADAMKLAGQAEKNTFLDNDGTGFTASAQDIQKATQALERQRDALLQTIKAKRDNKNLTKEEKAALDQEEAELTDLTNKLKALKFEQDNFNMSQAKMQELMRTPTDAVSLDELRAAIKRADGELKRMEGSLGKNNAQYKAFAEQVRNAKNQLKEMEGQAKASATAWEKAWSRLKTYVVMYMGFNAVWQKMTGTVDDLMQLSDKMGEVRKTTGFTADEVGRLSDNLAKLDTRTNLTGLMEFSAQAGSVGLKTKEAVEGYTEAANMLAVSLPEMGNEVSRTLMKISDATGDLEKNGGDVRETLERVGSTIIALRANSAAAASPIVDFVSRVGAVGAQAGISIDQIAALGATIDALGGRVEMSATALSRMIPAIRNNSFAVANAIGITEEKLKGMTAMEQMVTIFKQMRDSVKQFDMTTEEGMNGAADAIENMLGKNTTMQEVMKELNQQGARAGIVFGLLSQNVDTLEEQLGLASNAYRENTALLEEYNKMNDTTAAKWERLKNTIEEMFVSDSVQSWLGGLIDGLRSLVDLATGPLNGVFAGLAAGAATYSAGIGDLVKKTWEFVTAEGDAQNEMQDWLDKIKEKDIWGIVTSGVIAAGTALYMYIDSLKEAAREAARFTRELVDEQDKVEKLTDSIVDARTKVSDTSKEVEKARKEVEEAKKTLDGTTESTDKLTEANGKLLTAEEKKRQAMSEEKGLIEQFNREYSKYIGFMLSEISANYELEKARELVNAKLRETITLKRKEAALGRIESSTGEDRDAAYVALSEAFGGVKRKQVVTGRDKNGKEIKEWTTDQKASEALLRQVTKMAQEQKMTAEQVEQALIDAGLDVYETVNGKRRMNAFGANLRNAVMNYHNEYQDVQKQIKAVEQQFDTEMALDREESQQKLEEQYKVSAKRYGELETKYTNAVGDARKQAAADLLKQADTLEGMISSAPSYYDLTNDEEKEAYEKFISDTQTRIDGIKGQREALMKEAGDLYSPVGGDGKPIRTNTSNPYGDYNKRVDPYEQWDANALVKRREEMLQRVRALANGADVQAVLSEDKRFMDEVTRKGIKNMRDAIAWYNEERLKIQEELHSRNLTNTGDWMDPKKGGSKKKPKTPESEGAIAELDRYYSERKELIEEARSKEQMTEAEYNRRLDALEQEHLTKRSELRQTFTSEDKKFIQQFRQWWASVKELDEVSWTAIEAEWIAAWERDRKYNNREAQKDLTAMQAIVVKQLKEIEAIIDKERPFNGITTNLQDNLTKMGILFKDGVPEGDKFMKENANRLTFLLKEAENAYTLTWEQLAEDMRKNGLGSWADAIAGSENADKEKRALIAQLHTVYDAVQDAIKKEAAQVKKQVEIAWNDAILPNGKSIKQTYEQAISAMGIEQGRVSRANSLIGAGQASERVADKLAIKQMQLQLRMQEHYYNLIRKTGLQRIEDLKREAELKRQNGKIAEAERLELDAQHATMSLNLSLAKEQTELDKQREDIIARTEESQARLYKELREWGDLLASSVKDLMEASHAGDAEYYNELAKLNLTGKGGPGAGTYIVIDNAGTEDAEAHYEYLSEREALERQHEIERENAQAEAWRKVMDDLNAKMNEQITDWINASLQNQSIDANTNAVLQNTEAIAGLTSSMQGNAAASLGNIATEAALIGTPEGTVVTTNPAEQAITPDQVTEWTDALSTEPWRVWEEAGVNAARNVQQAQKTANQQMQQSTQSTFAKMTVAANLYGAAYQAMSNDNLDASQKWEMFALQAAGQAAISMLTMDLAKGEAENTVRLPGILGKLLVEMPYPAAMATYAAVTALLGGLMGMAVSQVTKSKAQISQVTGASSASAGKLTTGMLQYGEGNVNEFTDPGTLTVGRQYNVDAADGHTYRARYMGKDAKTHLTTGPEFHLVGEKGQEAIIDAHTTRNIRMNDPEIWHSIQTLYNGGSLRHSTRRRGVRAFADGNMEDFEEMSAGGANGAYGTNGNNEIIAGLQASLDRNSAVLERALEEGFKGIFDVYGKGGLVDSYDTGKKTVMRHGERY